MNIFRKIWRGAGYLEGYGHHPGWASLVFYAIAGGAAGIEKGGLIGFVGGFLFCGFFFSLFFMWGCIDRANLCDEDQKRLLNKIKNSYD